MMLYVNGEEITEVVFGLFTKGPKGFVWEKKPERFLSSPEDHLKVLVDYLRAQHLSIEELEGVALASGYGSATALRASHTLGNTLAFIKEIPLFSVLKTAGMGDEEALLGAPEKELSFLAPTYERAPVITKSEKDALRR
jgi:hypothetical protein